MRRIASEVQISARPEEVWSVLTGFERFHEWNPFLVEAAGRVEPGQRLSLRLRLPGNGREMVFKPTVLVSEPARLLRWRGRLGVRGVFDGLHAFELTPREGGTHVLQTEVFTGVLVPVTGSIIRQSEVGFGLMTDALKKRVESSASS
ncbi:SRPBCC domain-containing protein [Streptomyces spongiae]|uniref:SRPBCC domain-containing protein n=1 Tax=Streptomyces spongiae TaxID=565072 RepID=A0A5N8XX16_9ACTN|nr:SRPBCC domain-containing protein [Streptomyces spongiae]MPY63796.1 SRPBCC domain-containing protein [Streptomyces spongiae]